MAALRKVLVVIGTTGAGKTKLSVDLAKAVGGEIVNSDAMQMYRGLDIATAKITEAEKEGVPHHLFDIVDPSSRCDVLEFKRLALAAVDDILARGKVPIIVGGTMYYTQSILWKSQLLDDVPANVNAAQRPLEENLTPEEMFAKLQEVDPAMARRLHVNNVRKVQRSLQVFYQTGVPHSEHLARQEREQSNREKYFDACAFWVNASKPVLAERLEQRVDKMLASGLVDEIRGLRQHVRDHPPRLNPDAPDEDDDASVGILQAIGYKEFQPYFDAVERESSDDERPGDLDTVLKECVEQLNVATRQYARRQLSWIRNKFVTKNIPVYQVDSSNVAEWDARVARPSIEIATSFLAGRTVTNYKTVQEELPETAQERTLEDKFVENVCDICGDRKFLGTKQWQDHLRSKGHKYHIKRIELEKNGDPRRQKSSRQQTALPVAAEDSETTEVNESASKRARTDDS